MAQAYENQMTGEIVVMSEDGEDDWIGGVEDFFDNPTGTIVGAGLDWLFGDDEEEQPAGGGFGTGSGGFPQLPGTSGGGGGGFPQPGDTVNLPSPGSSGPQYAGGGSSNVPAQLMQWAIQVFGQNPEWLKAIGRKLGIIKGSPRHDEMLAAPGCASKLAEQLPRGDREAVEQYMCGFSAPMGSANRNTFLAIMIACSGADPSVCKCG